MSLFDALVVGHLVGDFLAQTAWMADNKASRLGPLVVHSLVYTLFVGAAGRLEGGLPVWALPVLFVSHALLDQRAFVRFWVRTVQGVHREADVWLYVVADQAFHVLVLAGICWLAVG